MGGGKGGKGGEAAEPPPGWKFKVGVTHAKPGASFTVVSVPAEVAAVPTARGGR